jgi:glycosyltransferase involved in cell wall biosynthesis
MTRLLSLNSYHYRRGGADVVYFEHDALFRELGWDTAFFAMHHPQNVPSEWAEYFVDELQYGRAYSMVQKLRMAGKVIYSFEAQDKLRRLLSRFRPDIAHAHNLYHHLSPSVLPLLRHERIPVVLTAHDLKLCCPSKQMRDRSGPCERCQTGHFLHMVRHRCVHGSLSVSALVALESALHRWSGIYRHNVNRIVVPSLFFKRKFEEWGWPAEQLTYIPNFVRIDEFVPATEPGDYFVYFGRLAVEKGFDTLLLAVRQSGERLVIVGAGGLEREAEEAVAASGGRLSWLGRRSGRELFDVVSHARAVIVPSACCENAPLAILEAYALGKPVIGADIGGIPELVKEGETGFLFPSGNIDGLRAAMQRMRDLPDGEVAAMGAAARRLVAERFTAELYRERMLDLYASLGVAVERREALN